MRKGTLSPRRVSLAHFTAREIAEARGRLDHVGAVRASRGLPPLTDHEAIDRLLTHVLGLRRRYRRARATLCVAIHRACSEGASDAAAT